METWNEKIGKIKLNDKVRVSDPGYDMDVWCAGTIENVLPGNYLCTVEYDDEDDRVAAISVMHDDYTDGRTIERMSDLTVGVDSGQCGIYDLEYFMQNTGDEDWYDRVCEKTFTGRAFRGDIIDKKALVASSGYGDGDYDCYLYENEERKVVGIKVVFIEDEDDDDFLIPDEEPECDDEEDEEDEMEMG